MVTRKSEARRSTRISKKLSNGSPGNSRPKPNGDETSEIHDGWLERYHGMLWVDDKHVIRPGAEMAHTAPKVQELMDTWRWVWRTGHGKILVDAWQGGIRFRMARDKGWSYCDLIGRMRYNPRGLRPCAAKCIIVGGVKKSNAVEISIDMSDDPQKQRHAIKINKIPGILRFTRQPGL